MFLVSTVGGARGRAGWPLFEAKTGHSALRGGRNYARRSSYRQRALAFHHTFLHFITLLRIRVIVDDIIDMQVENDVIHSLHTVRRMIVTDRGRAEWVGRASPSKGTWSAGNEAPTGENGSCERAKTRREGGNNRSRALHQETTRARARKKAS